MNAHFMRICFGWLEVVLCLGICFSVHTVLFIIAAILAPLLFCFCLAFASDHD